MRQWLVSLALVAACTKAGTGRETPPGEPTIGQPTPGVAPTAPPTKTVPTPPMPPAPKAKVELTAVTLADDCGGSPPWSPPTKQAMKREAKQDSERSDADVKSKAKRRCEQTSMQLSIVATDGSTFRVKQVELLDDKGASLGMLAASKPTRWSDTSSSYEAWDETFADGSTTSVSYVLAQPNWSSVADRWNKTYTLKVVVSIGGADQSATKDVTLTAPTTLPPNVKT